VRSLYLIGVELLFCSLACYLQWKLNFQFIIQFLLLFGRGGKFLSSSVYSPPLICECRDLLKAAWPGPRECPAFTFELTFHAPLSSLEILDIQEKPQENQRWLKMLTRVPNVGTYAQEALGGISVVVLIKCTRQRTFVE